MTAEKIFNEIEQRIAYLDEKESNLHTKRMSLRYENPWCDMTDREMDLLPRSSKFWMQDKMYAEKLAPIRSELSVLRDMQYAYLN